MKTYIEVNLSHEALHNWPDAKEKLPDVDFLSYPHRHVFAIQLIKEVSHDDRDVEIIMFKRQVEAYLTATWGKNFGSQSCEMIAAKLLAEFDCDQVRVLEDNENGAVVKKD